MVKFFHCSERMTKLSSEWLFFFNVTQHFWGLEPVEKLKILESGADARALKRNTYLTLDTLQCHSQTWKNVASNRNPKSLT